MSTRVAFGPALDTTDVDEARCVVGQLFCPHRLTPVGQSRVDTRLRSTDLGKIKLSHLDYGVPVSIEPGRLGDFYLVQMPLCGQAEISHAGDNIVSTPTLASVLSPEDPVSMTWGTHNAQRILYVDRDTLHVHLGRMLGRPAVTPVKFALGMRLDTASVQAWYRGIEFLHQEITNDSPMLAAPAAAHNIEQMILTRLLLAQPNNYSDDLAESRTAPSEIVRRTCQLIDEHLAEPLTVVDIAEAVGVSVRALQHGFRRDLDLSPTQYLRQRRMTRAHEMLTVSSPESASVTEIATSLGFTHLGRFSIDHRRYFGESPSESLARD